MTNLFKHFVIFIIIFSLIVSTNGKTTQAFDISAKSAILMEQQSGRVLYQKNEHKPMRIASITKIMTAILAIESGKLDEIVTISHNSVNTEGSSIYLKEGERISLEDLVYGLMLRSGNDAAIAIAEHVGGSVDGFVYLMNEKAKQIGMEQTVFSNPHGLDDHEEHYSTAYDMAILTRYAMKNEKFQEISGTKQYKAKRENGEYSYWRNKNRLLTGLYKYSTGGKTGYTKRAKRTLVSTASKDGMDLICVTLNAPNDWEDHINLFNYAFDHFELETLVREGKVKEIDDELYKNHVYVPYSFEYPLTKKERKAVEKNIVFYRQGNVNEIKGFPDPVGKVVLTLKGETIGEVPIYFEGQRGEQKKNSFWKKVREIFFVTIGVKTND